MQAFPKIFAMGTRYIADILKEEVEVTEKVDGSQFGFGKIDGEVICRSKGKIQPLDNPDKMFKEAVEYVLSIEDKLAEGNFYYAEYLQKPKHNNLKYGRIPNNHLILFGVREPDGGFVSKHYLLEAYADILGIEVVPLLHDGMLTVEQLGGLLDRDSVLGEARDFEGY